METNSYRSEWELEKRVFEAEQKTLSDQRSDADDKVIYPRTLNTDYLLWHTQLIVCAVEY